MIKSFEVKGLHGRFDFQLEFNNDLNIITGKNGSGKTSVLKLMWYLFSGHYDFMFEELQFSYVKLTLDTYSLTAIKNFSVVDRKESYSYEVNKDEENLWRATSFYELGEGDFNNNNFSNSVTEEYSLFFPTFRRIEGGFAIHRKNERGVVGRTSLERALLEVSDRLDIGNHNFITAISTRDIRKMLTDEYNLRLDFANDIQTGVYQEVIEKLKTAEVSNSGENNKIVSEVKERLEQVEAQKKALFQPFVALSEIVTSLFQHKGISISKNITFGETAESLSSDKLSAGEKQMLSFLSYNAFTNNASIFIDEPELSLHVDWQRELLPTLINQGTTNQFFIATHSPFIYGKYPDKEIELTQLQETL